MRHLLHFECEIAQAMKTDLLRPRHEQSTRHSYRRKMPTPGQMPAIFDVYSRIISIDFKEATIQDDSGHSRHSREAGYFRTKRLLT